VGGAGRRDLLRCGILRPSQLGRERGESLGSVSGPMMAAPVIRCLPSLPLFLLVSFPSETVRVASLLSGGIILEALLVVVIYSSRRVSTSTSAFTHMYRPGCIGHRLADALPPLYRWRILCRHSTFTDALSPSLCW
jgi:hypothetical protein